MSKIFVVKETCGEYDGTTIIAVLRGPKKYILYELEKEWRVALDNYYTEYRVALALLPKSEQRKKKNQCKRFPQFAEWLIETKKFKQMEYEDICL